MKCRDKDQHHNQIKIEVYNLPINFLILSEKAKERKDAQLMKKEQQLNKLSDEEVIKELKQKQLPTFGTKHERLDRLKKCYGKKIVICPND